MVAYNIQWRPLSLNYKTIFIILPPNIETVNGLCGALVILTKERTDKGQDERF